MFQTYCATMLLSTVLSIPCPQDPGSTQFNLETSAVTAIESGPLIIKASLRYQGHDDIWIVVGPTIVKGPETWRRRQAPLGITVNTGLNVVPTRQVKGGDALTLFVPVHLSYPTFPAGNVSLEVSWTIYNVSDSKH